MPPYLKSLGGVGRVCKNLKIPTSLVLKGKYFTPLNPVFWTFHEGYAEKVFESPKILFYCILSNNFSKIFLKLYNKEPTLPKWGTSTLKFCPFPIPNYWGGGRGGAGRNYWRAWAYTRNLSKKGLILAKRETYLFDYNTSHLPKRNLIIKK